MVLVLVEDRTRERRVEAIRRDFVANVSHELKTPIGALTLLAEAVQEAADDPEAVQRFACRMQTEAARLNRLVQQIIELSRLQGDEALDRPAVVEVDRVVEPCHRRGRDRGQVQGHRGRLRGPARPAGARQPRPGGAGAKNLVVERGRLLPRAQPGGGAGAARGPQRRHHRHRPRGSASRAPRSTGSSSASTASTRPGTAPPAAPAWGCRSSSTSRPRTGARCKVWSQEGEGSTLHPAAAPPHRTYPRRTRGRRRPRADRRSRRRRQEGDPVTRVLVVEDEESYSDALAYMLRKEGFEVAVAEHRRRRRWRSSSATAPTSCCST